MRITLIFLYFILPFSGQTQEKKAQIPYSDSITVYLFLLDDCKICNYYMPTIKELHATFDDDQINFIGLFPNFSSKTEKIERFKVLHDVPFPLKTDYYKGKAKSLGASIMPEVVVFDEKNETILYHGRIDNSYVQIGQQRRVITSNELQTVLQQIKNNDPITIPYTQAIGCFINFTDNISRSMH